MSDRYCSYTYFHIRFRGVTLASFQQPGVRQAFQDSVAHAAVVTAQAVTITAVKVGSVIVSTAVAFLEGEETKQLLLAEALQNPAAMFAAPNHAFFTDVTSFDVIEVSSSDANIPTPEASGAAVAIMAAMSLALWVGALAGLYKKLPGESFREKVSFASLKRHGKHLSTVTLSIFDLSSDVLFAASLAGIPWFSAYFFASLGILLLHLIVSVVTIWFTFHLVKKSEGPRGPHMNLDAVSEHAFLYSFVVLSAAANLEAMVCLPWNGRLKYDGFPAAKFMWLTTLSTIVEDIPQLAIQATFVYFESGSIITFVSLSFTSVSLAVRLVGRLLHHCGGQRNTGPRTATGPAATSPAVSTVEHWAARTPKEAWAEQRVPLNAQKALD